MWTGRACKKCGDYYHYVINSKLIYNSKTGLDIRSSISYEIDINKTNLVFLAVAPCFSKTFFERFVFEVCIFRYALRFSHN